MRDTKNDLLYIGNRVYQKSTILLDIEVLEALEKNKDRTPTEAINRILREVLLDE